MGGHICSSRCRTSRPPFRSGQNIKLEAESPDVEAGCHYGSSSGGHHKGHPSLSCFPSLTYTHTLFYGKKTTPVSLTLWSPVRIKWEGKLICHNILDKTQLYLSHPALFCTHILDSLNFDTRCDDISCLAERWQHGPAAVGWEVPWSKVPTRNHMWGKW